MEKSKYIQVINALVASCSSDDLSEIIYELIVEKEIDKKTIRNKVIKEEFNILYRTNMPIMDIYSTISDNHNLSERTINYIIYK